MMQLGPNLEVEIAALTPTTLVEDLDHYHHQHLLGQNLVPKLSESWPLRLDTHQSFARLVHFLAMLNLM